MDDLTQLDFEDLRSGLSSSDADILIRDIEVHGNGTGNIMVGNHNTIGDDKVFFEVHNEYGVVIHQHSSAFIREHGYPPQPQQTITFLRRVGGQCLS